MAINFPDNPTPTDTFTDAGKSWIWDGTTWKIYSSTSSGIGLGDLSVNTSSVGTAALSYNNTTGVFTYTPPDLSGYITSQYTLPTASTTVLGGVKVDGSTITINGSGVISGANTYSLPTATTTVLGGVKIDGTTITINNGVISGASSVPTSITVANESTDTECFPLFSKDATGDIAPKTVTSVKLNSSSGQLEAGSFKKTGGSSTEFLKADGSIDSTTYLSSNVNSVLDMWQISADVTDSDSTVRYFGIGDWTQKTGNPYANLGYISTYELNGIFRMPSTGYYEIEMIIGWNIYNALCKSCTNAIYTTTNDSTYTAAMTSSVHTGGGQAGTNQSVNHIKLFWKVNNISNDKFKISYSSFNADPYIESNTSFLYIKKLRDL